MRRYQMFCTKCGGELKEGARFCEGCGATPTEGSAVRKSSRPALFYVGLSFLIIAALIFFGAVGVCATSQIGLDDLQEKHDSLNADFDELHAEHEALSENYTTLQATYVDLQTDHSALQTDYDKLQSTKQINFGNGLLLSDVMANGGTVSGKVQNLSDASMSQVEILVAYYHQDGSLSIVATTSVSDLFPQEVADWSTWGYSYPAFFDVYAVGNRQ
jgi:FtsZ-binding cell division protein ZapB